MNIAPIILWQGCQPEQLILELTVQEQHAEEQSSLQQLLVRELQQLLCGLFLGARELLIEVLPHGFSLARVVKVQPFYARGGGGQQMVVKFGAIQEIKQEYENYLRHVRYFVGDGRSAVVLDYRQKAHLGAISYTFLGTAYHLMQEFGMFYQQASSAEVKQALDTLFRHTCGMWYANHDALYPLNLTENYQRHFGYTIRRLEQKTQENLLSVSRQRTLTFKALQHLVTRELPNPFYWLESTQPVIRPTYVSTTHGDLNQRNILVDQTEALWLIDFQSTGPGHILRDVAMLDTVIRLQLLHSEQATLEERLILEEAICNIRHFSQLEQLQDSYSTSNPALSKAWETVMHLRTLAHWMIEKNPFGEISEYYLALLYSAMNSLRFTSLEKVQYEHALLSASLLVDTLGLGR